VPVIGRTLRLHPGKPDPVIWHTLMVDRVFQMDRSFDVIHFHIGVLQLPVAAHSETPSLTTLHGRLDLPDLQPLFRHFRQHPLVSISQAQRTPLSWANWLGTVHHGLPLDLYTFHPQAQDYFAFVGRNSPEKRCDRAIEIALACGMPLPIAAKVDDADRVYWKKVIEPRSARGELRPPAHPPRAQRRRGGSAQGCRRERERGVLTPRMACSVQFSCSGPGALISDPL
jgi:glycosyltransferase involved in cell wall biosynthesis